ncbi:MAG: hypothetical protein J0H06_07050 [Actinobacteria bacterium]|nr:hypothetical protein [Actinomycetota bacterium]
MSKAAAPYRLERDGSLTHLILEHPPLNLFDGATFDSLEACVGELAADPPRGVLVRAIGRVVSAGADIVMPQISGSLFGTEDLQNAVRTFLREGPGHAAFEGR